LNKEVFIEMLSTLVDDDLYTPDVVSRITNYDFFANDVEQIPKFLLK
jgi:hypothetical protein